MKALAVLIWELQINSVSEFTNAHSVNNEGQVCVCVYGIVYHIHMFLYLENIIG